jgi:filamentous hemagglutinin
MAVGGAVGQIVSNVRSGEGVLDGVVTAAARGARDGAVAVLTGEGIGAVLGKVVGAAAGVETGSIRGSTVTANAAQGASFEAKVVQNLEASGTQTGIAQHVSVRTQSGVRVVVDVAGKDAGTSAIRLTEAKSSATAPLTRNQRVGYPEIAQSGGTVVGAGKPGYPGGTRIPPTRVNIVRPEVRDP